MTIDEAIECERNHRLYPEYHDEIAEWLEELKTIKSDGFTDDLLNMGFTKGYNKAIDDFVQLVKKYDWDIREINENEFIYGAIDYIAEQLKEGGENE